MKFFYVTTVISKIKEISITIQCFISGIHNHLMPVFWWHEIYVLYVWSPKLQWSLKFSSQSTHTTWALKYTKTKSSTKTEYLIESKFEIQGIFAYEAGIHNNLPYKQTDSLTIQKFTMWIKNNWFLLVCKLEIISQKLLQNVWHEQ